MRAQHVRHAAATRLRPLACGCVDPWLHRCRDATALTEGSLDGWADALGTLTGLDFTPLAPVEVLRALWRRGGSDRRLAQAVHQVAAS
jgi:hypothetical protein